MSKAYRDGYKTGAADKRIGVYNRYSGIWFPSELENVRDL